MTQNERNRLNRAISEKRDEIRGWPCRCGVIRDKHPVVGSLCTGYSHPNYDEDEDESYCSDWLHAGPLLEEMNSEFGMLEASFNIHWELTDSIGLTEAVALAWAKWKGIAI